MPTNDIREYDLHDCSGDDVGVTEIVCIGQNSEGEDIYQYKELVDGTTGTFDPLKVAINAQ